MDTADTAEEDNDMSVVSVKREGNISTRYSQSQNSCNRPLILFIFSLLFFQSSTTVDTADTAEEDNNMSVVSVKERAKHLNRMESESELIQQTSVSSLGAPYPRKNLKDAKKVYK